MIKLGGKIGALNTLLLIFLTAIIGVYFAKLEGIKTIQSGFLNLYQNRVPIFELLSGASIAMAAILLIVPGFLTDLIGFLLIIPFTRKFFIKMLMKKNDKPFRKEDPNVLDGEIIEDKKDEL